MKTAISTHRKKSVRNRQSPYAVTWYESVMGIIDVSLCSFHTAS